MKHETRISHRAVIVALAVIALFNSAIAPMAARASQTLTLVVKAGAFGTVSNTSSVASATADPNGANNSATTTTTVQ